jgi:hypothetical protein
MFSSGIWALFNFIEHLIIGNLIVRFNIIILFYYHSTTKLAKLRLDQVAIILPDISMWNYGSSMQLQTPVNKGGKTETISSKTDDLPMVPE